MFGLVFSVWPYVTCVPEARDTRKVGTDDWASRLEKVTQGQNNNPIDEYLEGVAPAQVSTNSDLIRRLKEKNALYADFNHQRVEKRGQKLEEAGKFRGMEDMGGKFTRGFKPRFGEVRQVKEVQGATVVDDKGKDHLTNLYCQFLRLQTMQAPGRSSREAVN